MAQRSTAIGYIRHSTTEQGRRMSPALQRRAIEKWAAEHGLVVRSWFQDSAPGSTPVAKRQGLQDALAALAALGPSSALIVYRLDRLARDLELQLRLFRAVAGIGARIVSTMNEGTDGNGEDDPDAVFLQQLQGALSQRERGVLARRIRDGVRAKKAQGRKWNGQAPYGYRWDPDDRLAEHKAEQRTIRLVLELREQGVSYRGIVDELKRRRRVNRAGGPFVLAQVQRILQRATRPPP